MFVRNGGEANFVPVEEISRRAKKVLQTVQYDGVERFHGPSPPSTPINPIERQLRDTKTASHLAILEARAFGEERR
jgi:hypothetical protein